ncbi:Type II secretion system protein B [Roseateles sp. YR242]|uniref:general secretion pathway protein GspB n=1 Tax=Roseateles sp. YR242 TaxID=1855305 RepID=UPI0008C11A5A|nr:general secretion pathway protein GspB [Roseateles sp. YR242]SEK64291.1 Type II secretion system protein B [Roseateles sp. YR242]
MSIILQALRTRAARSTPWSTTLHAGLGPTLPEWLGTRRGLTGCAVTAAIVAALAGSMWGARGSPVANAASSSASNAVPLPLSLPEEADIPMLQSLPRSPLTRTVAVSGVPPLAAATVASGAGATGSTNGAMVATAAGSTPAAMAVPRGRLPLVSSPPRGVFIAPPGSLSTPLPLPGPVLPPGAVPGQVPPAPGGGTALALARPATVPVTVPGHAPTPSVATAMLAAPAARAAPTFLTIDELPPSLRGAIEGVRVQLHLYGPVARQRLLVVAGKRLREGDDLVDGVRLEEITPQGMVLSQGAQRFLIRSSSLRGGSA